MLDHFFNLTKKRNLIGRFLIGFNTVFDNLIVVSFFGPPFTHVQDIRQHILEYEYKCIVSVSD